MIIVVFLRKISYAPSLFCIFVSFHIFIIIYRAETGTEWLPSLRC